MLNFLLMLIILALCIPGIWVMSIHSADHVAEKKSQAMSKPLMIVLIGMQTLIITGLCAAAGSYLHSSIGIHDLFLEGLTEGRLVWLDLWNQLKVGVVAGVICSAVWLGVYYGWIRPRLDLESVIISERIRLEMSLWTRMTSGGILEEVIFRWGLLIVAMWGLIKLTGSESISFWIGVTVTGVLFGLAHLPGNLQAGCKPSKLFVGTAVFANLWVSIICGYLLWQYGLIAAIVVHMLFHVFWYPLDKVMYRKTTGTAK